MYHNLMRVVSSLAGLVMIVFGCIWILQGLNIAFLVGPMVGDKQWVVWGGLLALLGVSQIFWSVTRKA